MTDEQINAAIAEACPDKFRNEDDVWFFQYAKDCWNQCHNNSICNDLNAMHEAEDTILGTDLFYDYCLHTGPLLRASARQRAEAFLRTLGKWEEPV